jgi:hypothetical protein
MYLAAASTSAAFFREQTNRPSPSWWRERSVPMTKKLNLAFILDPLERLRAYKDSSVAMMREAARRGHTAARGARLA